MTLSWVEFLTLARGRRRAKKPLDESEREEQKSWLKAQHSENEDHGIWGTLEMVARPWSSSRLSCGERLLLRCDRNAVNFSRTRRVRIPPLELGGGNGAPLDVGGTLVLPLEWRRVCRGTS